MNIHDDESEQRDSSGEEQLEPITENNEYENEENTSMKTILYDIEDNIKNDK